MFSMTGYGRGEATQGDLHCVVECSSVNRKGLEVSCQLPREVVPLEIRIRDRVRERISRGRINVVVQFPNSFGTPPVSVDLPFARRLVNDLRFAQTELGLSGSIELQAIMAVPGVLRAAEHESTEWWQCVDEALSFALDNLIEMRQREGEHLAADILSRLAKLETLALTMRDHSRTIVDTYRTNLLSRIEKAALEVQIDDSRLAAEIALFAERSDVSEEITRIESHCTQFREKIQSPEPAGRALEFLTQEIFRELNTLGAKAGDCALSRLVVDAKVELDTIREQTLNVE